MAIDQHALVDTDPQWVDVEIALPSELYIGGREAGLNEASLELVRDLIGDGVANGYISERALETATSLPHGNDHDLERRLRLVMEEMGIEVDGSPWNEDGEFAELRDLSPEEADKVDEALLFLMSLEPHAERDIDAYQREVRALPMLASLEEAALHTEISAGMTREEAHRLARSRKLDEYQSGVRELERRIERLLAGTDKNSAAGLPQQPAAEPEDFPEHVRVMYELAAFALISDVTRVGTFLVTNEGSNRSYPFAGVPEGHHEMSHHGGEAAKLEQWEKICAFHSAQFGAFVEKLRAAKEGEQTVLARTLVVFGSGISDGNRHNHEDLPIVLVGGSALGVKGGRELVLDKETSLNCLHLALLEKMGAHEARLGDASELLPLG